MVASEWGGEASRHCGAGWGGLRGGQGGEAGAGVGGATFRHLTTIHAAEPRWARPQEAAAAPKFTAPLTPRRWLSISQTLTRVFIAHFVEEWNERERVGGRSPLWKRQEANLGSASPCYVEYGIEFSYLRGTDGSPDPPADFQGCWNLTELNLMQKVAFEWENDIRCGLSL